MGITSYEVEIRVHASRIDKVMFTFEVSEVVFVGGEMYVKYYSFDNVEGMIVHMIRDVNTDMCAPSSGLTQLERNEIYKNIQTTILDKCTNLDEHGRAYIDWKDELEFDGLMGYVWLLKRYDEVTQSVDEEYDLCDIYTPGENGNDRDGWSNDGAPDTHPHLCESSDE